MWAVSELEHVGRIAAVEDPDIQYAYAMSTVNGMLHLRNALYEIIHDKRYVQARTDLTVVYDQVQRAIQHLVSEYKVDKNAIEKFNVRKVLGNINNINWSGTRRSGNRKLAKTFKRLSPKNLATMVNKNNHI